MFSLSMGLDARPRTAAVVRIRIVLSLPPPYHRSWATFVLSGAHSRFCMAFIERTSRAGTG